MIISDHQADDHVVKKKIAQCKSRMTISLNIFGFHKVWIKRLRYLHKMDNFSRKDRFYEVAKTYMYT